MLRLISRTKTGEFFNRGEWTRDSNQAQDFPDAAAVFEACARHQLKDVAVYFWFDAEGHFLSVPLSDELVPTGREAGEPFPVSKAGSS